MNISISIDLKTIYSEISGETAKLADLEKYVSTALNKAGEGNTVTLTGGAPIWMYLKIAHALHGKAQRLLYSAPGQGIQELEIFSHNPF
jgi:hypothetical protein